MPYKDPVKQAECAKRWRETHRDTVREQARAWAQRNKIAVARAQKEQYQDVRLRAIAIYGDACEYCDESDQRCLHFHHITAVQGDRRGENSQSVVRRICREGRLPEYALACANCHEKIHG